VTAAGLVVMAVAVPLFLVAASLSRIYVADGRLFILVTALALYTIGNILMVRLMREVGLGVAISLATIAQLVLINVVAFAVFQERPTPTQFAGILVGAAGMVLMLLPAGNK
jgi:glucose uptake protein